MKVSRSGYYEWRDRSPPNRDLEEVHLADTILDSHAMSRCSHDTPREHAELWLGTGIRVGRKRVARLLRILGRRAISHRHKRRHRPAEAVHQDLVQRRFVAAGPDLLGCTDITEHPTRGGKVSCAAVLDVFARQGDAVGVVVCVVLDVLGDVDEVSSWHRLQVLEEEITEGCPLVARFDDRAWLPQSLGPAVALHLLAGVLQDPLQGRWAARGEAAPSGSSVVNGRA